MQCPRCGYYMGPTATQCPRCIAMAQRPAQAVPVVPSAPGGPLGPGAVATTPPPLPGPAGPQSAQWSAHLRPCAFCGQSISTAARACPRCGQATGVTSRRGEKVHPLAIGAYCAAGAGLMMWPLVVCPVGIVLGGIALALGDKKHGAASAVCCVAALGLSYLLSTLLVGGT